MVRLAPAFLVIVAAALPVSAQHDPAHHAMMERGRQAMGFDQERSTHHFLIQKEGGAIEIQSRDPADAALAAEIRAHLRHVRSAFADGDFALPFFIHDGKVPGADVLKARRARLTFVYEDMPAGGRVLIRTSDAEALGALHAFLRFQITEHRTGDPLDAK